MKIEATPGEPNQHPPLWGGILLAKAVVEHTAALSLDASLRICLPVGSRMPPHELIKEVEHAAELVCGVERHGKCVFRA